MSFVDNLSQVAKQQRKEQDVRNKQSKAQRQVEIRRLLDTYESSKAQFVEEIYLRISNSFEYVVSHATKTPSFTCNKKIDVSAFFSRTIELYFRFNSAVNPDDIRFFYDNNTNKYICPKLDLKEYYEDSVLTAFFWSKSQEREFIGLLKKKCSKEGINLRVTIPQEKNNYLYDNIYIAKIKMKMK